MRKNLVGNITLIVQILFYVVSIDFLTFPVYNNYDILECNGLIVTAGDKVLFFAGNTHKIKDMEQLKNKRRDYAFLSIDGYYNMNAVEAMEYNDIIFTVHSLTIHVNAENYLDMTKVREYTSENRRILFHSDVSQI